MCLIFLSLHEHPQYKLIIAANRDEFYARKTEAAHFWKDYPAIVGGRDLEAMGTWMAMNKNGRISLVTNYRDPFHINPQAPSRGQLVSDFLVSDQPAREYLKEVESRGKLYNGFNLMAGTADALYYYSNYREGIEKIPDGIHGLSNHLLDSPWPKVERGKRRFKELLSQPALSADLLFEFLYDEQRAEDNQLPDTGIGIERERALSSMFIKTTGYGTRCSTVVLVDRNNQAVYAERVYDTNTFRFTTQEFKFSV